MLSSRGATANSNDNPSAGAPPRKADEDDEDYFRAVYIAANANPTPEEGEQSHFAIPLQWACSCARIIPTRAELEREVGELLENAEQQELLYASGKKSRPLHQRSAAYDSTTYLYRLGIVLASSASKDIPILTGGFFLYRFLVWLPLTLIGWVKTNCYRRTAQVVRAKIAVGEAAGGAGAGVLRAGKVKDEEGGPLTEQGQVGPRQKKQAGQRSGGGAEAGEKEEEEDSFTTMWDRIVESERQKDLLLRPQGRGDDPAANNQSDDADSQPAGKPSSRTSDRRKSLLEMHGRAASGIMRSVAEDEEPDAAPLAGSGPSRSAITAEWIWPRGTTLHGPAVNIHPEHDYKSKKVVFYIHGGAFILCNSQTHRYATVTVVQLSGCILFSPNYRKPPTVPLDVSIQDCCEAYLHLVEDFKVPAARICVMGDSAGAALGLQLILQIRGKGEIWQRVLRNRKQRQMEMAEVGTSMKRGEIEIDDRPAARRGPDAPQDEPDYRTPTPTCSVTKKNSTFMPGSAILVSPWVDPSSTCGRSFLVNSHLDIFRVETDYGDGWQPRHAFLSVHPREMVQAFINLVLSKMALGKKIFCAAVSSGLVPNFGGNGFEGGNAMVTEKKANAHPKGFLEPHSKENDGHFLEMQSAENTKKGNGPPKSGWRRVFNFAFSPLHWIIDRIKKFVAGTPAEKRGEVAQKLVQAVGEASEPEGRGCAKTGPVASEPVAASNPNGPASDPPSPARTEAAQRHRWVAEEWENDERR
eukprot:g15642.t1